MAMIRFYYFGAILPVILLVSCREKPVEVEITETRALTTKDGTPKVAPTSEERFEGGRALPKPASVGIAAPDGWQRVAGNSIRLVNFRIGPNSEGEVYLSKSRGGVSPNAARWLRQFGIQQVDPAELTKLPKQSFGGLEGVLVEAEGVYAPGMGRPEKPDQALVGVIAAQGEVIWTLKMTGAKEVVLKERETFLKFCQSLELPE